MNLVDKIGSRTDADELKNVLDAVGKTIVEINTANGWNVTTLPDWERSVYKIPAVLALIHEEVSEALQAYRVNDHENFAEELADVLIRVLDLAAGLEINLAHEVFTKLEKNKARAFKHGGKKL